VLHGKHGLYVLRVNFIHGMPAAPTTSLVSQLYQWQDGKLVAVSNSLSADIRFATDTVIYRFTEQQSQQD
jgi:hypothetical protein